VAIDDDAEGQSKLGHKCCGCCCDTRRAVIIVEIVFGIFINILNIIFVISGMGVEVVGDPYLEEDIKNALKISAVFYGLGIGVAVFVMFGARIYNIWIVAIGLIWNIVQTICAIAINSQVFRDHDLTYPAYLAVIEVVIVLLIIYPKAMFIYEVHSGIMSPETYDREEQSCCCV